MPKYGEIGNGNGKGEANNSAGRTNAFRTPELNVECSTHGVNCIRTADILTIYAPMIYTAPCITFWMCAYP